MPRCIVKGCGSVSGTPDVRTHTVPSCKSDMTLRKKWLSNAGRLDLLFKTSRSLLCNKHFNSKCYQKNMRAELTEGILQYDLIPGSVPTIFQTARYDNTENVPPGVSEQHCSMNKHSQQTQQCPWRILPSVPCVKEAVSSYKDVLEEEDFSVLVDLSNHETSVDGLKDVPHKVQRKNVKHGRVLGDISNTVHYKLSPTKKTRRSMFVEGGTQTEPIATRSVETQTEESCFVQPKVNFKSDHTYSRQKMSTPAKTSVEPMHLDVSVISAETEMNEGSTDDSSSGSSSISMTFYDNQRTDPDYMLSSSSSDDSLVELKDQDITDKTFLVFGSSLEQLFSLVLCMYCGASSMVTNIVAWGTRLIVNFQCTQHHDFTWKSQPDAGKRAVGNVMAAAAVLFSGAAFSQVKRLTNLMKMSFISDSSFSRIQDSILVGVVNRMWEEHQAENFRRIQGVRVSVAGDGRCDSPGFSAKYGTYTMMDLNTNLILDFYITQCTEAGNSVNMEKYGLKKCIEHMMASNVSVDTIATDRHVQIRSFLKKEHPEVNHQFDVWHIGKSIGKKISQKSKMKGFEKLKDWRKSIVNHLWYSCATCDGDEDILIECWVSVLHHITNVHVFPGNHVTECRHGFLEEDIRRKTKWLKPNSAAYLALKDIVMNTRLLKDIRQCSKFCHTGNLESYHSLMLKYCPKRLHYSMPVMNARTQLAALDHNLNVNRSQATIKKGQRKGEARYRTECPKMSKEWVAKKLYEEKSYEHVHELMDRVVMSQCNKHPLECLVKRNLPKNISGKVKPDKEEIIRKKVSRFSSID